LRTISPTPYPRSLFDLSVAYDEASLTLPGVRTGWDHPVDLTDTGESNAKSKCNIIKLSVVGETTAGLLSHARTEGKWTSPGFSPVPLTGASITRSFEKTPLPAREPLDVGYVPRAWVQFPFCIRVCVINELRCTTHFCFGATARLRSHRAIWWLIFCAQMVAGGSNDLIHDRCAFVQLTRFGI
jgi:hypothetical protein